MLSIKPESVAREHFTVCDFVLINTRIDNCLNIWFALSEVT